MISELTAAELEKLLPEPVQRHGAEDGGLPARRPGRRAPGARARRPGVRTRSCWRSSPTRASARWWCPSSEGRHDRQPHESSPSAQTRVHAQLRRPRRWPWPAARAAASGTPTAASTSTSSAASRSTPSATPTRRWSRPSPGRSPRSRTPPTCSCTSRRCCSPSGCSTCSAAPGRVFFSNSGAEANEAALKLAAQVRRAPAARYMVAAESGFHGRTIGALALTGKPANRDPFGPFPVDVRFVPYGDAEALQRGGHRRVRRGLPGADPGRGRRGPAAGRLPRGGPRDLRRDRRAAGRRRDPVGIGRTGALVRPPGTTASCPTSSPWPRASAAACRSAPASPSAGAGTLFARATTAPPSAATRSRAPRRSPYSTPSRRTACWTTCGRSARGSRDGHRRDRPPAAGGRPRARPVAGGRADRDRSPRRCSRPPRRARASWSTPLQPDAVRLAPPLVVTSEQVDAFVAALPRDPRRGRRCRTRGIRARQALPAGRRPVARRAGRGARPGRRR